MTVLPLLDVPRGILFFCALNCITYFQHSLRNFRRSFDIKRSLKNRFGHIFVTLPSTLLFCLLFTGAYLWCLFEGLPTSRFNFLLPLTFILCSIGYWESWIDLGHSSGIFHEVYQVISTVQCAIFKGTRIKKGINRNWNGWWKGGGTCCLCSSCQLLKLILNL